LQYPVPFNILAGCVAGTIYPVVDTSLIYIGGTVVISLLSCLVRSSFGDSMTSTSTPRAVRLS